MRGLLFIYDDEKLKAPVSSGGNNVAPKKWLKRRKGRLIMKKTIIAMLIAALSATSVSAQVYTSPQYQAQVQTETKVNVNVNFEGKGVDYEQGFVYATGTGRMAYGDVEGYEDLAREAAIMDAQRNLVGAVNGVQIDSMTTVEMKVLTEDTIKRQISGVIRGGIVVDEGLRPNGSYYVKMIAPLYGVESVAAAVLPDIMPAFPQPVEKPQQEVPQYVYDNNYSGLIIDAQGVGLVPAMSPVIYDTNGRAIYGIKNINADFAVQYGMAAYARGTAEASMNTQRIGHNPLVIKAVSVKGGANSTQPVNVVVTPEDGDKILAANEKTHFLEDAKVILVR